MMGIIILVFLAAANGAFATYSLSGNWLASVMVGATIASSLVALIASRNK